MAEIEGFEEALRQANEGRRQQEIKMESAKEYAHQLQTHIDELQMQAADKDVQLQQLNEEKSAMQTELGQLSASCEEAGQSRLHLENELSTARETIVDLQSVIMKMEEEQTELHTQTARLDQLTSTLKSEGESKDQLIANFIRDQEHCDLELEELKQQENILLLSIQQLETDQTKSKEQVESFRETVSALEAEKVQV
jgi:chromosome segregation ATPase